MSFFQTLNYNLTGGIPWGDWASMLLFYLLGAIVCMYLDFLGRDEDSKNTPENANWAFWWRDNKKRIFIMPVIAFLLLRFISAWVPILTQYMEVATGLGLIGDGIFIVIREVQWWYRQKFSKIKDRE
jgi:amino acid transporter